MSSTPSNLVIDPRSSFSAEEKELKPDHPVPGEDNESKSSDETIPASVDEELADFDEVDEFEFTDTSMKYAIPLPDRLYVDIHTLFPENLSYEDSSSTVGTIHLDPTVFGQDPIRVDLLKRAVNYIRNKKRGRRKAVTKTISTRSGSGRKLRHQKGQGRARIGHGRAAHHRGGAKAHGPKNVTDYGNTKLNKKVRWLALVNAFSQKLLEGNLILLNQLHDYPTHKTSDLARRLAILDIGKGRASALILDTPKEGAEHQYGVDVYLHLAAKNLVNVSVGGDHAANVYDILRHEKLVVSLAALETFETRYKNKL